MSLITIWYCGGYAGLTVRTLSVPWGVETSHIWRRYIDWHISTPESFHGQTSKFIWHTRTSVCSSGYRMISRIESKIWKKLVNLHNKRSMIIHVPTISPTFAITSLGSKKFPFCQILVADSQFYRESPTYLSDLDRMDKSSCPLGQTWGIGCCMSFRSFCPAKGSE